MNALKSVVLSLASVLISLPDVTHALSSEDLLFHLQNFGVNPGEVYAVEADCLRKGNSTCVLTIAFKSADGRWRGIATRHTFPFEKTTTGWGDAAGVLTVPAGARALVVLLRTATARQRHRGQNRVQRLGQGSDELVQHLHDGHPRAALRQGIRNRRSAG